MNTRAMLVCSCAALLVLWGPAADRGMAADATPARIDSVFQMERSFREDVVHFRNKDVLRGEVLNDSITISTQYGQLTLPIRQCAGLSFEGARANTEAIVTVNFNRITGIVTDRVIRFKIASSGETIQIRKEKVRFVLLKKTEGETQLPGKAGKSDVYLMANGDVLTGKAADRKMAIRTDYALVNVGFDEMKEVTMQGGDNVTAVIAKTNGDTMRGTLETDDMTITLDVGTKVPEIYKDKLAAIYFGQALVLAPSIYAAKQPIAGESTGAAADVDPTGRKISFVVGDSWVISFKESSFKVSVVGFAFLEGSKVWIVQRTGRGVSDLAWIDQETNRCIRYDSVNKAKGKAIVSGQSIDYVERRCATVQDLTENMARIIEVYVDAAGKAYPTVYSAPASPNTLCIPRRVEIGERLPPKTGRGLLVMKAERVSVPAGDFDCWVTKWVLNPEVEHSQYFVGYYDKTTGLMVKEENWAFIRGQWEAIETGVLQSLSLRR